MMKLYGNGFLIFVLTIQAMACSKKTDNSPVTPPGSNVHTYYVSGSGSDSNKGSMDDPFQSINTALNHAVPGDTVMVRGGVYYEKLVFPKSGLSDKEITLKAYPGERPVIDGSNINVSGSLALVTMSDARYISLEGFDICNLITAAAYADPEGIMISGNSHDITIRDCHIYNIKSNASLTNGRSGHAILILGNGFTAITGILITGCSIHDTQTGTSENVTFVGNVDGFTFSHNQVYNTENIGVIVAGGDNLNPHGDVNTNYARNGVISDNVFHDNTMTRTPDIWGPDRYGAISIYICGGANTIVERNKVYNSDRGIGLVSESNIFATKSSIVRNNFVYNCYRTGIYMGDYLNYTSGGTKNCYVVNNTLFQNDRVPGAFGEIEGEIRLTEHCDSNVVENNIVYASPVDVFIHKYTTTGSNNIIDNNLYFTTGVPRWIWNSVNGPSCSNLKDWQAACAGDLHSGFGTDPLLVSTTLPDLHIQPASPAKNSGKVISADINGEEDIDGNPRIVNGLISKGAQQVN